MEYLKEILPERIATALLGLENSLRECITEVRLRSGKPAAVRMASGVRYIETHGLGYTVNSRTVIVSFKEVEECYLRCCNGSVYTHENEISEGFIALPFGNRVGLSGEVITRGDGSRWYRRVTGLNIRIAHQHKGCADKMVGNVAGGVIIFGAPHSGKTTILRDYARSCSNMGETVVIVDCRGEISGMSNGVCSLDVGENTDVTVGGEKADGIEVALRTLSPDLIVFDELANAGELAAVRECLNGGVRVVTTVHAGSVDELLRRNEEMHFLESGAFSYAVMTDRNYRQIIYKVDELYDKANRHGGGYGGLHRGGHSKGEPYAAAGTKCVRDL